MRWTAADNSLVACVVLSLLATLNWSGARADNCDNTCRERTTFYQSKDSVYCEKFKERDCFYCENGRCVKTEKVNQKTCTGLGLPQSYKLWTDCKQECDLNVGSSAEASGGTAIDDEWTPILKAFICE